jgi:hypothetical protein
VVGERGPAKERGQTLEEKVETEDVVGIVWVTAVSVQDTIAVCYL